VRPFLSSTFKDFNEERNICFAQSFPRLEKLCNQRNLFFAPLDLRWGVTSEQSGSGQVIKICLGQRSTRIHWLAKMAALRLPVLTVV